MNTPNPSNTQTDLKRVLEKITEIAEKSADGDYIYRGESKCHDEVSSNLYREYADVEAEHFDIEVVQKEILREVEEYTTHKMEKLEILTELQHHGGKTNLIDCTTDYLVALFFACDGNRDKPGKVILLQQQSEAYKVVRPPRTVPRAGVQKSIFVQAPSGVVDPDTVTVVCIPADLKGTMLDHLRKYHDISTTTIYNDLLGFIENRRIHKSAYTEFYKGLTCQNRANSTKNPAEKQREYDKAVGHYTEAIDLNPEYAQAYNNRGAVYSDQGEVDKAIQDYNTAIDLNPEYASVYYNRGNAYADKGEVDKAIQDYNTAIDLNPENAAAYNNRGNAYAGKGEMDKAIQDYNTAIDLNPEDVEAYTNRGNAYADKGEIDAAIQDYTKAIDLNPENAEAYTNRGNAYVNKGEIDAAIQDYNTAIDLNPEHAEAYTNRGVAYGNKGEFDLAIQDFNKAIDLNPENAEAYNNRGEAWLHLREWEKAKADLITAKNMGRDIAASFHNDYESIEAFEAKRGVKVPEDIAVLLRRD